MSSSQVNLEHFLQWAANVSEKEKTQQTFRNLNSLASHFYLVITTESQFLKKSESSPIFSFNETYFSWWREKMDPVLC